MKIYFLLAGLNLNIIAQEKKHQTNAHFMDDALKTNCVKYLNVATWLLFASTV